jgi:hypothetical protein
VTGFTGRPWPFTVAPEVADLVGDQELRLLARLAAFGPFECIACGREATAAVAVAAAVAVRTAKTAASRGATVASSGRDLILLRLAHRSCLESQVIDSDRMPALAEDTVFAATAMQAGQPGPRPLLLVDFTAGAAAPAGPDGRADLLIRSLLEAGMTLVTDLATPLPQAPGFSVRIRRGKVSILDPAGAALAEGLTPVLVPGWQDAVRASSEVAVMAGSGLGLESGSGGLADAVRQGQVAGGRVPVRW